MNSPTRHYNELCFTIIYLHVDTHLLIILSQLMPVLQMLSLFERNGFQLLFSSGVQIDESLTESDLNKPNVEGV